MADKPTIIDTFRGVKDDIKKTGVNLVSTVKSARHSAGHLGFGSNVKNFRKNMGLEDQNAFQRVRGKIVGQEAVIQRPGFFMDKDGKPKYPIYNKIKNMGKKTEEKAEEPASAGNLFDQDLADVDIHGRDLADIKGRDLAGKHSKGLIGSI